MSQKPTRFQKELQKEIDRLESIVLTEQLKESIARERKETSQKQVENLKSQLNSEITESKDTEKVNNQ